MLDFALHIRHFRFWVTKTLCKAFGLLQSTKAPKHPNTRSAKTLKTLDASNPKSNPKQKANRLKTQNN
ncbi:hypothetical protein BKN38_04815 [Helicobacter sp. CLO-3]|nr:hypothetical protein BA723_07495 [Helicobacter sp. CLO-3]OHU83911.1 hypothetical protein BKN38_04815 [Helicobacter sp. CLO-3]